jgi:hypothetical protein
VKLKEEGERGAEEIWRVIDLLSSFAYLLVLLSYSRVVVYYFPQMLFEGVLGDRAQILDKGCYGMTRSWKGGR